MRRIIPLLVVVGLYLPSQARVISVPQDYTTIQAAINASLNGDTILAHPGIYHENVSFLQHTQVLASLYLTTGDTSYISSTIIDGNGAGAVITIVRSDSGSAVIGLTIRNGLGHNGGGIISQYSIARFERNIICQNIALYSAGGIGCSNGSYIIRYNTINNNIATHSGGAIFCQSHAEIYGNNIYDNTAGFYGGAIFSNYSDIIISENHFENNVSLLGGAICCQANPTISENIFIQNHATQRGGGIFCWAGASPTIDGNQIINNYAELDGGGIYLTNGANATISNNIIDSNNCYYGAGIYCSADAQIKDNTISNNSGPFGAGIYCVASSPLIVGNQFSWNFASMRGAGIYCYDNAAPLVMHNRIFENNGQGIYCYESSPMIVNNIIVQNVAEFGAGLYTWDSHPFVANSIFWSNQSDQGPDIVAEGDNSPVITYCDIQQGWPGNGNINSPPLFRDVDNHDYHLSAIACSQTQDSPCIDAGWPDLPDSLLDCDHGLGMIRSDMGAYGGDLWMVDIESETAELPEQFLLEQNYPNPFNAQTVIAYDLSSPSNVRITIYDILGRVLTRLVNRFETAGRHQLIWDAAGMSSGIYLYRIEVSGKFETKKMVLMK